MWHNSNKQFGTPVLIQLRNFSHCNQQFSHCSHKPHICQLLYQQIYRLPVTLYVLLMHLTLKSISLTQMEQSLQNLTTLSLVNLLKLATAFAMRILKTTVVTVAFAATVAPVNVIAPRVIPLMTLNLGRNFITGLWTAPVDFQMDPVLIVTNVKDAVNVEQPLICQLLFPVVGVIVVMPTSVKLVTLVRLDFIHAAVQSALVPHPIMGNLTNTVVIPADLIRPVQSRGIQCLQSLQLFSEIYKLPTVYLIWNAHVLILTMMNLWLSLHIASSSWKILSLRAVGLSAHVLLLTMANLANTAVTRAGLLKLVMKNGINGPQNLHSAASP